MSQFDTDQTKFIKYESSLNDYYYFPEGMKTEELDRLAEALESVSLSEGTVSGVVNKEYRDSRIYWIPKTEEWQWLYNLMGRLGKQANDRMWHFDITAMEENIQYTEYDESYQGKYDWHLDIGSGRSSLRKIAMVVQLSDPADYEGGELEFFNRRYALQAPQERGTVICFPTYFLHRVTPVTKGRRKTLVLWISGPPFR